MFDITTRDIKYLQGVGPQRAALLDKELQLRSLRDLLYYFPYKYVDRSRLYYIHEIDGNMPYIQLKGEILSFETIGEGRQRRLVAHFSDDTGVVDLVWFQGIKYLLGSGKSFGAVTTHDTITFTSLRFWQRTSEHLCLTNSP